MCLEKKLLTDYQLVESNGFFFLIFFYEKACTSDDDRLIFASL